MACREVWREREFQRRLTGKFEPLKEPDWGLDTERRDREFAEFMAQEAEMPDFLLPPDPTAEKGDLIFGG